MPSTVFISWSGHISQDVATALKEWLPEVVHGLKGWMSAGDLQVGRNWLGDLRRQLAETNLGILVITRDNLTSPWLFFEAGAMAKSLDRSRVCPYLVGVQPSDVTLPLAQFQAASSNREGTFQLVQSLNASLGRTKRPADQLQKSFDVWWPHLEQLLARVASAERKTTASRSEADLIAEAIEHLRYLRYGTAASTPQAEQRVDWPAKGSQPQLIFDFFRKYLLSEAMVAAMSSYENVEVRNKPTAVREAAREKMRRAAIVHGLVEEFEQWASTEFAG